MTLLLRTIAVSAAALCTFATSADVLPQFECTDCRSTEFSYDFGNYALNLTYGPNSTEFIDEAIITNSDGGWVYVDLSFELVENIITGMGEFIGLDLGIPTGKIVVKTTTDTTQNAEYTIDLDMIDTMGPLPVGENNSPPPPNDDDNDSGSGDSSGGGSTGGGGVGAGSGSGSGGGGSGGGGAGFGGSGWACTSAGNGDWYCVAY